jgi:MoaA/NifB/PqqE/SkfB family radical SAM enzyme
MACTFCTFPQNSIAASEELSLPDFRRLATELSGLGRFLISIEGGEPFVRPDLVDIVRALSLEHLTVLYTNGWYATAENVRALFDAGLAQVGVSIDFPDRRHDLKRGVAGALDRALRAIELFREAAPHGAKQVHIITVLMKENIADVEALLQLSAKCGVGHVVTLLSESGARRGNGHEAVPEFPVSRALLQLWKNYPHWKFWSEYLEKMDSFLSGGTMPACRAGLQSMNVDHAGNVAVCIEKIDQPVGNIRQESLATLHDRLVQRRDQVENCQACWTACRAFGQLTGGGGSFRSWWEMAARMRSL